MNRMEFTKHIIEKLENLGVGLVYFFGSRAMGNQSPKSDADLGVVFFNRLLLNDSLKIYKALYKSFSKAPFLSKDIELDIILLQLAPITLQFEVINLGRILYESSSTFRANYEEYVMKQYIDMKPKLDEFEYVTLEIFS
jgi:predicted nucleotidyltransferase